MGFPGAWLYAGDQAVLHVMIRNPLPEPRAGVLDHMAFSAVGLTDTVKKLEQKGLKYSLGRQVETGVWQLFFHDPNGARVELDFTAAEKRASLDKGPGATPAARRISHTPSPPAGHGCRCDPASIR